MVESSTELNELTELEHRFYAAGMALRVKIHRSCESGSHSGAREWPECKALSEVLDDYMDQYRAEHQTCASLQRTPND